MRNYLRLAASLSLLQSGVAFAAPVTVPATAAATLAFDRHNEPLWCIEQLMPVLVALFVLFTGLGARLREICARLAGGRRFFTMTLFVCSYLVLAALMTLPFEYYKEIVDLRIWGKLGQTPAQWLTGKAVGLAVKLVIAALFAWIPYTLIAKRPRLWWLYSASALMPVAFLVIVVLPVWVAPLTNHYEPLADQALLAKIDMLEARCGISKIPIFIGGNEDTVVGLGPTNRIVLNKDIFKNETPDQIEFTVGHEMKHYLEGDNWKALAIVAGLLLIGFFLVDRIGRFVIARRARRLGFNDLADPASFPMAVLVLSVFWLMVSPLFNVFARHIEHEADRFSLELTHQNEAMGTMFAGFSTRWGQNVEWDDFQTIFYATHPSNGDRIRFSNTYRPWDEGKPLVYGDVCKPAEQSVARPW